MMSDTPYTASSFRIPFDRRHVKSILEKPSTRIETLILCRSGWAVSELYALGIIDFIKLYRSLKTLKLELRRIAGVFDFAFLKACFRAAEENIFLTAVEMEARASIFFQEGIIATDIFEFMRGKLTKLHLTDIGLSTQLPLETIHTLATCICSLQNTKTMRLVIKSHEFLTTLSSCMMNARMPNLEELDLVVCGNQPYEMTSFASFLSNTEACFLISSKLRFEFYLHLDITEALFIGLTRNTSIRELKLRFHYDSVEVLEFLGLHLASLANIEQLTLYQQRENEIPFPASVWPALRHMESLCRLQLHDSELEGASQAKDLLIHTQGLKHLELDIDEPEDPSQIPDWLQTIVSGLRANTTLTSLTFAVNLFVNERPDVKPLLDGILAAWENQSNLVELSINAYSLYTEFTSDLARLLVNPVCKLSSFVLNIQLTSLGTVEVLSAVLLCPSLKKLTIEKLKIDEITWMWIASHLPNLKLECIKLKAYAPEEEEEAASASRISKELLRGMADNDFLLDASFLLGLPQRDDMMFATALEDRCFQNKVAKLSRALQHDTSLLPVVPRACESIESACNSLASVKKDSLRANLLYAAIRGRPDLVYSLANFS